MKITRWAIAAAMLLGTAPAFAQVGQPLKAPQKRTFSDTLGTRGPEEIREPELEPVRFDQFQELQKSLADLEKRVDEIEKKMGMKEKQKKQQQLQPEREQP